MPSGPGKITRGPDQGEDPVSEKWPHPLTFNPPTAIVQYSRKEDSNMRNLTGRHYFYFGYYYFAGLPAVC